MGGWFSFLGRKNMSVKRSREPLFALPNSLTNSNSRLSKTRKSKKTLSKIGKLWLRPSGRGPQAMHEKAAALSIMQHSIRKGVLPRPLYI